MSKGHERIRRYYAAETQAHALEQATRTHTRITGRRSADGDPARIRGIPVQGAPGVGGTQRGTRPGAFIDRIPDDT